MKKSNPIKTLRGKFFSFFTKTLLRKFFSFFTYFEKDVRKHRKTYRRLEKVHQPEVRGSSAIRALFVLIAFLCTVALLYGIHIAILKKWLLMHQIFAVANTQYTAMTLKTVLVAAPVSFALWLFRDRNKLTELNTSRKDTNLKDFYQLQLWATGRFSEKDTAGLTLQIASLHQLRAYLRGVYGQEFKRPSFEIFKALFEQIDQELLEIVTREIKNKSGSGKNLPDDEIREILADCIEKNVLAKTLKQIVREEWFALLVNHDFPLGKISLVGVNLSHAYLRKKNLHSFFHLSEANLYGANLQEANLQEANLLTANLQGAYLQDANLKGAKFQVAKFQGTNLQEANLRGANIREANLQGVYLFKASLLKADLREADLREADLREADLREADLLVANLQGANLQGADLQGAYLQGAYLQGANLREADLRNASLVLANLYQVQLENTDFTSADLRAFYVNDGEIDRKEYLEKHRNQKTDFSSLQSSGATNLETCNIDPLTQEELNRLVDILKL